MPRTLNSVAVLECDVLSISPPSRTVATAWGSGTVKVSSETAARGRPNLSSVWSASFSSGTATSARPGAAFRPLPQPQDVLFRGGVEFDPVLAWALIAGLGPHHGLGHAERNPHPAWLIDDDRDLDREFGMSLVGLTTCGETLELKARGLLAEPKLGPLGHEVLEVFEGETEDCLQQAAVFISEEQHRWLGLFDRPFDGRRHFLGGRAARRVHGGAGDGCR